MADEYAHKWGYSIIPVGLQTAKTTDVVVVALCANPKCGKYYTKRLTYTSNNLGEGDFPVPRFGCVNPFEDL